MFGDTKLSATFYQKVIFLASLLFLSAFLWYARHVLLLVFTGTLLALAFTSMTKWVRRFTRLPHIWALLLTLGLLIGLTIISIRLLAPGLSEQFANLVETLPKQVEQLNQRIRQEPWFKNIERVLPKSATTGEATGGGTLSSIGNIFSATAETLSSIAFILFLAIFLAAKPELYRNGLLALVPPRFRARGSEILAKLICVLKYWLLGQLIAMVVVGLIVGVSLKIAGIPMAAAIGVIAGVLEFIPFVGPVISAIPAVLLAFTAGPDKVLIVLGIFAVVQFIEGNLLMPLVQNRTVDLPPAITLISVLIFGAFFGFIGVLLATPIAAVAMVLVQEIYIKDVLKDGSTATLGTE